MEFSHVDVQRSLFTAGCKGYDDIVINCASIFEAADIFSLSSIPSLCPRLCRVSLSLKLSKLLLVINHISASSLLRFQAIPNSKTVTLFVCMNF